MPFREEAMIILLDLEKIRAARRKNQRFTRCGTVRRRDGAAGRHCGAVREHVMLFEKKRMDLNLGVIFTVQYTAQYTVLFTVQYTGQHTVQYNVHILDSILYSTVYCTVCCTVNYTVYCTAYCTVHCTAYCTVYCINTRAIEVGAIEVGVLGFNNGRRWR